MTKPVLRYLIARPFDEAETALRQSLQEEGFGILTEVDVTAVLRQKLGVEVPRQKILGACNPSIAHKSITLAPDVAAYLPCGIALRQGSRPDETVVVIQNPESISEAFGQPALREPAGEAMQRLEAALRRIGREA